MNEEVEDGEEVNQGKNLALVIPAAIAPVQVVILDSKVADDLSFPLVLHVVREEVDHSFIEGGGADTSSEKVSMMLKPKTFIQKKYKLADPPVVQDPHPVALPDTNCGVCIFEKWKRGTQR